ncbi:hypothetical protein FACS1894188_13300 [Clostridia bacterium]|nr:hypothetical protein FACS1894188_13300 [Clostridia bacterium]
MTDILIVAKKEFTLFFRRKDYVRWYITLICVTLLAPFAGGINESSERMMYFILFLVYMTPNNLSIDTIGGEKTRKTLETFLCTHMEVYKVLLGKFLFVQALGTFALAVSLSLNSVLLQALGRVRADSLPYVFLLGFLGVAAIALVSSVLAYMLNNLKTCGYIITLLNLGLIRLVALSLRDYAFLQSFAICLFVLDICFALLIFKRAKKYRLL